MLILLAVLVLLFFLWRGQVHFFSYWCRRLASYCSLWRFHGPISFGDLRGLRLKNIKWTSRPLTF